MYVLVLPSSSDRVPPESVFYYTPPRRPSHPFASIKIKKHFKEAMVVYKEVKHSKVLDTLDSGGKLDAFRHSFTMAYLVRFVNTKKLRKLGEKHEKGNKNGFFEHKNEENERSDSLACVMDLRNNELGFMMGALKKKATIEELKNAILEQISLGNAWYLKKNNQNKYVSCNNEPILIEKYKNQWFIPKCLIKTNE